jgi:hypothetical protein
MMGQVICLCWFLLNLIACQFSCISTCNIFLHNLSVFRFKFWVTLKLSFLLSPGSRASAKLLLSGSCGIVVSPASRSHNVRRLTLSFLQVFSTLSGPPPKQISHVLFPWPVFAIVQNVSSRSLSNLSLSIKFTSTSLWEPCFPSKRRVHFRAIMSFSISWSAFTWTLESDSWFSFFCHEGGIGFLFVSFEGISCKYRPFTFTSIKLI